MPIVYMFRRESLWKPGMVIGVFLGKGISTRLRVVMSAYNTRTEEVAAEG